ncbi:hypothetical protein KP509_02G033800 [Ceratopteris richardii]|uniref:Bidirectional sugar transporter SWEET n=1 Tax=Ceratopteris richardii TaxID=49495 RepID=A0A8T2VCR9_CERRI|nr:hypothetical protein KP509_02G033800 [Ceratopteris richardii]
MQEAFPLTISLKGGKRKGVLPCAQILSLSLSLSLSVSLSLVTTNLYMNGPAIPLLKTLLPNCSRGPNFRIETFPPSRIAITSGTLSSPLSQFYCYSDNHSRQRSLKSSGICVSTRRHLSVGYMALLSLILGIFGVITAYVGLLLPIPKFWEIIKRRNMASVSPQPYLFNLTSALFWTYYGLLKNGRVSAVTISASGNCAFQIFYLSVYLWFGTLRQRKSTLKILTIIVLSYGGVLLSTLLMECGKQPVIMVGILGIITVIFGSMAPLTNIHKAMKTRNTKFVPLQLSLGLLLNGSCWLAYSLSIKDKYLTIRNVIGISLSIVQVVVYIFIRIVGRKLQKDEEIGDKEAHSVDLNKVMQCPSFKEVEAMGMPISSEIESVLDSKNVKQCPSFKEVEALAMRIPAIDFGISITSGSFPSKDFRVTITPIE